MLKGRFVEPSRCFVETDSGRRDSLGRRWPSPPETPSESKSGDRLTRSGFEEEDYRPAEKDRPAIESAEKDRPAIRVDYRLKYRPAVS